MEHANAAAKQERGSAQPEPGRCGAKLKYSDPPRYCRNYPVKGRKRCRLCGGKTLVGVMSPHWKDGKQSKYPLGMLPPDIREHYARIRSADSKGTAEEMALLDSRVAQLLTKITARDPASAAREARQAVRELRRAVASRSVARAEAQLKVLEKHLADELVTAERWAEVRSCLETRDKLHRTHLGWEKMLAEKVLVSQLDAFVRALVLMTREVLLPHVKRPVLAAYVDRVQALAGANLAMTEPVVVDAEVEDGQ